MHDDDSLMGLPGQRTMLCSTRVHGTAMATFQSGPDGGIVEGGDVSGQPYFHIPLERQGG